MTKGRTRVSDMLSVLKIQNFSPNPIHTYLHPVLLPLPSHFFMTLFSFSSVLSGLFVGWKMPKSVSNPESRTEAILLQPAWAKKSKGFPHLQNPERLPPTFLRPWGSLGRDGRSDWPCGRTRLLIDFPGLGSSPVSHQLSTYPLSTMSKEGSWG